MPGFDGTGPNGQGAKTGRGLGNCDDVDIIKRGFKPKKGLLGKGNRPRRGMNNDNPPRRRFRDRLKAMFNQSN